VHAHAAPDKRSARACTPQITSANPLRMKAERRDLAYRPPGKSKAATCGNLPIHPARVIADDDCGKPAASLP
jgi:hypothetical protein